VSNNNLLIFKEKRWFVVLCDLSLLLVTGACIWLNIYSFFLDKIDHDATGRIITFSLLFTFCPFLFLGRTTVADIHVDDDGIGWWFWGRRWKYIRWANAKVMTIETILVYGNSPPMVTFYNFYRTEKTPTFFYPLKFGDDIPNAGALVAAVTQYVRQHNIKVLDRRGQTDRRPLSS
jgi:hypothetical protein